MEESLQRLLDRAEIEDVLHRYCRGVDRIQLDVLASVFHPDAVIDYGAIQRTAQEFVAYVGEKHPKVPFASHMVMNKLIDFLSPQKAFVESWCLALERHPPNKDGAFDIDRVFRVRYGDIFEKRGGAWRIAKRMTVIDHVLSAPVDPALQLPPSGRFEGRRDADDPVMKMRAALGLKMTD